MNAKLLSYMAEAMKNVTEVTNKVVDASDAQKHADGVKALGQNVDETYASIRRIIEEDESLSTKEKIEMLEKLAVDQQAERQNCEDSIKNNREHVAKVAGEVFLGLATGGLSYIPKIVNDHKKESVDKHNYELNEGYTKVDFIEDGLDKSEDAE